MLRDFIADVGIPMMAIVLGMIALITVIALPIAWFDGHAKSAWLKQTQSVDIPWYQATFLSVNINDQNVTVGQRK